MPGVSLTTTSESAKQEARLAAVYAYLEANVEASLCSRGTVEPAVELRSRPWIKAKSDGALDGVFLFHDGYWHAPLQFRIGEVQLFLSASPAGLGWEDLASATVGLTPSAGYQWRKFTGTGLLAKPGEFVAYRRHGQAA